MVKQMRLIYPDSDEPGHTPHLHAGSFPLQAPRLPGEARAAGPSPQSEVQ